MIYIFKEKYINIYFICNACSIHKQTFFVYLVFSDCREFFNRNYFSTIYFKYSKTVHVKRVVYENIQYS